MASRSWTFGIALMVALAIGVMTVAQGQETPKESPQLAFRAQTDVVVVPFQVRRGSRPVSNLTSADVVLLEDGRRRDFTGVTATRSTSDPKVLLDALRRLSDPMPAEPAFNLSVPAGTVIRSEGSPNPLGHPWPLSLTGAMTALQDSALGLAMGARALVIVSTGAEGTSIRPEDLADQALSADVHVYPVALPSTQAIWYDGDNPNVQWENLGPSGPSHVVAPRLAENGICQDIPRRGRPPLDAELLDCPLNAPFKAIGTWTGGRSFEAARRPGPKLPHTGSEPSLSRFSMTGAQVIDILDVVKEHALARFTATYRVWFTPSPSASPRKHTLEVKLAPKSSGTVSGGKKSATY